MRIGVGIATRGRAKILRETLAQLGKQTRKPDRIVVCHTVTDDVAGCGSSPGVEFIVAQPGLTRQRNRLIEAVNDCDVLLFLDDDFFVSSQYVAITLAAFETNNTVVATTGMPISDGIKGPGIGTGRALQLIADDVGQRDPGAASDMMTVPHGYGCNMAIRLAVVRRHDIRFDERLPLYGWSEDVDYTHRLGRHGRIVKLARARGVHLGTKQARSPGRNLGYSQVANPIYLWKKGSYSWGRALRSVGRNLVANAVRSVRPEPWIDRRGRLLGNGRAFADWLQGRMAPERVLEL
jgi:GT2 family glycosyltransferase